MAAHASLCVKQCAASMMNALTGRAASGMSSGTTVKSTLAVATAAATTTTTTTTTPKLLPYEAMGRRHFGSNIPETGFFSEGTKEREGLLFNESPGPRKWETWEPVWYTTLGLCVIMLGVGLNAKPETSLHVKARQEMLKREREG